MEGHKNTAVSVGERDGEKTYKCEKCGNEKKESEGNFILDGSAFCCLVCCPKDGAHGHTDGSTCEFC